MADAVTDSKATNDASKVKANGAAPKKKICCVCPETRQKRDECMIEYGEESCQMFIEAHKQCLRREGFDVK